MLNCMNRIIAFLAIFYDTAQYSRHLTTDSNVDDSHNTFIFIFLVDLACRGRSFSFSDSPLSYIFRRAFMGISLILYHCLVLFSLILDGEMIK